MITIGTDVEVFLYGPEGFSPAHNHLTGTKEEPQEVNGGAVQVDGVAAELNTVPASTFEDFEDSLQRVTDSMLDITKGVSILSQVTVPVDLATLPPEFKRLSCMSDMDPYDKDVNPSLNQDFPYRSAGGHIHIGGIWGEGMTKMERYGEGMRLARLMDKYVGVYSLLWDKDNTRRSTYGKAGAFRMKDYGIEYRALSNAWFFMPELREFVFNATLKACDALKRGEDVGTMYRDIINKNDISHQFFWWDHQAQDLEVMLA